MVGTTEAEKAWCSCFFHGLFRGIHQENGRFSLLHPHPTASAAAFAKFVSPGGQTRLGRKGSPISVGYCDVLISCYLLLYINYFGHLA